jgi:hypothetical protein
VANFLWENVNEPNIRKEILASYGFCPTHTRLLVAKEFMESATVLGVNILYEHLARVTAIQLSSIRVKESTTSGIRSILGIRPENNHSDKPKILPPKGKCPVCVTSNQTGVNGLSDLMEELDHQAEDIRNAYLESDGICLKHIRLGIGRFGSQFPHAAEVILTDTSSRLEHQAAAMKEYIRKTNWAYRDEKMTKEEANAWRKTLTFFTGLPGEDFTHKVDEF